MPQRFDLVVRSDDDEDDAELERQHFEGVVKAFSDYRRNFERRIVLAERRFNFLPKHMKGLSSKIFFEPSLTNGISGVVHADWQNGFPLSRTGLPGSDRLQTQTRLFSEIWSSHTSYSRTTR